METVQLALALALQIALAGAIAADIAGGIATKEIGTLTLFLALTLTAACDATPLYSHSYL